MAPAPDGTVWYTAQRQGALGRLDPAIGELEQVPLGSGSAPHGVIVGADGAAWMTDGGLNAIVRVDPANLEVEVFLLPEERGYVNLNAASFDGDGVLWFTGQNGIYGRLDPATGEMRVWDAPRGRGPYGITTTPEGDVYYASLAGNHIARIDTRTGEATVIEPPTPGQGARRVWSDSRGRIWVSEWNAGQVSVFDPASGEWRSWKLPGEAPRAYSVYVDERDDVWLSDFGANAIVRFDPGTQRFESFPSDLAGANVRQMLGRPGEVGVRSPAPTGWWSSRRRAADAMRRCRRGRGTGAAAVAAVLALAPALALRRRGPETVTRRGASASSSAATPAIPSTRPRPACPDRTCTG